MSTPPTAGKAQRLGAGREGRGNRSHTGVQRQGGRQPAWEGEEETGGRGLGMARKGACALQQVGGRLPRGDPSPLNPLSPSLLLRRPTSAAGNRDAADLRDLLLGLAVSAYSLRMCSQRMHVQATRVGFLPAPARQRHSQTHLRLRACRPHPRAPAL